MISPAKFCQQLDTLGLRFFTGVPDSLLKSLCAYIDNEYPKSSHVITANEGNAISLACGHYLGSGKPAVVYMQNSGLGNAVNPLASLADEAVYSIPMLLVIGWRGEAGVKDEPQHVKQGVITEEQLALLDIDYMIIDQSSNLYLSLPALINKMHHLNKPVALLVKKGTFSDVKALQQPHQYTLNREQILETLLDLIPSDGLVVSTTGKTSREVFELRRAKKQPNNDFLTVGAMGHTASIAMGVAKAQPDKKVFALDGDGSLLMHMGAMPVIAQQGLNNLTHVVLNNGCHESVGGQLTVANEINIVAIANACGYKTATCIETLADLINAWPIVTQAGTHLIEIKINAGSRSDLGRPTNSPIENKKAFMQHALN
ncbi:phosphonopyruvate decarboxylase [Algibacillus agarilyticus]|uniref:phosphonopyruvate decarboxylase n=1 Tax=Algibacillus agarilyticus TaxID=2234133 RepID=UPI000DD0DF93|nr:phosphonopyruvate decarboxylase [Algibacillus agarilyticus]